MREITVFEQFSMIVGRALDSPDNVGGAPFHFEKNQADVLADDADREQLDGAHEQYDHDRTGPTPRRAPVEQGVKHDPNQQNHRHEDGGQPQIGHQPQGVATEADQAVDRQPDQGAKRIFRLASRGPPGRRPDRPGESPQRIAGRAQI